MTALAARRRRSTLLAAGAAALAVAVAGVLVTVGAVALYNSTEGADAADRRQERTFASTPNGLLAAVDDEGNLASVAVFTVRPSGDGGSIVTLPVSADASGGFGPDRLPLAETVALHGIESLEREVESALRLDLDRAEVADADALEELLEPVGDIDVDLPTNVTDRDGDEVAESGPQTLRPAEAAAVLTARDPDQPAAEQFPAAAAVWAAVAETVGDGPAESTEGAAAAGPDVAAGEPGTIAELFGQLAAGRLRARALAWSPLPPGQNPRQVDVVQLDGAEISLVFGQISPGQVAAPNPSLSFRVESRFSDEQLAGPGLTNADVAYSALLRLLFTQGNVMSVTTRPATAPEVTTIYIAHESMRAGVESGAPELLGEIDVRLAEDRITGIDAVIQLGQSFLDHLDEPPEAPDGSATSVANADGAEDTITTTAGTGDPADTTTGGPTATTTEGADSFDATIDEEGE